MYKMYGTVKFQSQAQLLAHKIQHFYVNWYSKLVNCLFTATSEKYECFVV